MDRVISSRNKRKRRRQREVLTQKNRCGRSKGDKKRHATLLHLSSKKQRP